MQIAQLQVARAGYHFHFALSVLFHLDVALFGANVDASFEPNGVDVPRAGVEVHIQTNALVENIADAGTGLDDAVSRSFDLVINDDVGQLLRAADADHVSVLLNRRSRRDIAKPVIGRMPVVRLHMAGDAHPAGGALADLDVAGTRGDRQIKPVPQIDGLDKTLL